MSRLRFFTAGESHGPAVVTIVEGVPAGLQILAAHIDEDLGRRQRGYGRGPRMKIEQDRCEILSGVRGGETLGSPIALLVRNRDHENWLDRMRAEPMPSPPEPLTRPRPGHADLAGGLKYDRHDLRDVLERASARETAARTAAGAVAKKLLASLGVDVFAHVRAIGPVEAAEPAVDLSELRSRSRASDLACADPAAEERMKAAIREAAHAGDTLGGAFEVVVTGAPPGLGSHVQWDRRLDGRLGQAILSVPAVKAVEIGDGFESARSLGSRVHDPIGYDAGDRRFTRSTNHAGGIEGGISNGEPIVCRGFMKPLSTLKSPLASVDVVTKAPFVASVERSDVAAVAAAAVVGEAVVALAIGDALLEKFGGDSMAELVRNVAAYREQLRAY